MEKDKLLLMLGLATKAGKVSHGNFLSDESVKKGKARLMIIASDASESTKKGLISSCEYYNVQYVVYSNSQSISNICGKNNIVVLTVNDNNFASALKKIYDTNLNGGEVY